MLPLIDDHEIQDNWEPGSADPTNALRAWQQFQHKLLSGTAAPPFDQTALDPGYIKGYPPGVRENAGQ